MSLEGASKGSEEAVSRALVLPSDIALHFTPSVSLLTETRPYTDTTCDSRPSTHHLLLAKFLCQFSKSSFHSTIYFSQ